MSARPSSCKSSNPQPIMNFTEVSKVSDVAGCAVVSKFFLCAVVMPAVVSSQGSFCHVWRASGHTAGHPKLKLYLDSLFCYLF